MARLSIPSSEFGVLRELAVLPDSSFSELWTGLKAIEPEISQVDISELLSRRVPSISTSTLRAFLVTLFSCYRIMVARERTAQEVAGDIAETIEREAPQGFPVDKKEILQERLQKLFSIGGSVAVVAKAIHIMLDQDRIFCGAKILSDIRPIFSESPDEVKAAIIMHSLNISFHKEGEHRETYVAMTDNDLKTLKKVIERAEKKSGILKSLLQKSGTRFFSTEQ